MEFHGKMRLLALAYSYLIEMVWLRCIAILGSPFCFAPEEREAGSRGGRHGYKNIRIMK